MELTFLGTAASEGYPNAFCRCRNCERARELGGPNLRLRSSAVLDRRLLIYFGPDLMSGALKAGISLVDVQFCLLTHPHADHLDPSNFSSRSPQCQVEGAARLAFHASPGALRVVGRDLGLEDREWWADSPGQEALNVRFIPMVAGNAVDVGPYRVTPVPARHGDGLFEPMLFAIEHDGRALFYATDTGPLPEDAWSMLHAWGGRFDAVVLDHTFGMADRASGHLNAEQFLETVERLKRQGSLARECRVFAHHLGHHSNPDHDTLAAWANERGYEIPFDGLTVCV